MNSKAKCASNDVMVQFFFPEGNARGRAPKVKDKARLDKEAAERHAARFCRGDDDGIVCPVMLECLKTALDEDRNDGVWGGMSESERRKYKKEMEKKKYA